MEVYGIYVILVVVIIIVKLFVIGCIYCYRVQRIQRLTQQQRIIIAQPCPAGGASAYPAAPYNQGSNIVKFEELPQPSALQQNNMASAAPPSYNDVPAAGEKPPAYNEAIAMPTA